MKRGRWERATPWRTEPHISTPLQSSVICEISNNSFKDLGCVLLEPTVQFTSQAEESKIMRSLTGKCILYLFTRKRDFCPRFEDWMKNSLSICNSRFNIQTGLFLFLEASLARTSFLNHILIETFTPLS